MPNLPSPLAPAPDAAFYRRMLEAVPAPLVVFDAGRRYLFCNPAAIQDEQIRQWIIGHDDFEYCAYRGFAPELARRRHQQFDEAERTRQTVTYEEVFERGAATIHQQRRITPLYGEQGQLQYFLGYGLDITGLKAAQDELLLSNRRLETRVQARTLQLQQAIARLEREALHDPLTGLPNRLALTRFAQSLIDTGHLAAQPYGLLVLDTDRFKAVNDSLGHAAGDELLRRMAQRLALLPKSGRLYRLGGNEFVLLFAAQQPADLDNMASMVTQVLSKPLDVLGHELLLSVSMGSVLVDGSYQHAADMLRDADIALHRAKAAGRAQHRPFEPPMREAVLQVAQTEKELRQALRRGEFALYFQPIVDLRSGGVHGFEALLRWNHPERGLLAPGAFLPIAEEMGLMPELNAWVLRNAAQQLAQWDGRVWPAPAVRISVNVSGDYFARSGLLEELSQLRQEYGLRPGKLSLELTESVLLTHSNSLGHTLEGLGELGFDLHIDDFGTGYSSLSYIQSYPFSVLKIDRSFVGRMTQERSSAELVRTIISMAKNLRMRVTAEGIETDEQRQMLQAMHCDYGQGYLFARPLPEREAWEFWQARSL